VARVSLRDRKCEVPDVSRHRVSRAPDVSLGQKFWPGGLRSDEVRHRRVSRALGVNHGQKFWPDDLRNDEVRHHHVSHAMGVRHDRKCVQVGLRNDVVLPHRVLDVSHDRMSVPDGHRGQKFWLGGRREFREVRGRRSETCCGGQEVLGSSRGACRHRQLGERRVNHASHVPGARHDRRCAERGLPNVMKVRQFLLRVACVDRGRRLPKHPCGELI
jgi:hypothetical protein